MQPLNKKGMFTGIINEVGKVVSVKESENGKIFAIQTKKILKNKKIGQSLSVNGVCSTVTAIDNKTFTFDSMPETLKLTNLSSLKQNDKVNLEASLTLGDAINGHLVQGHVDTQGTIKSFEKKDKSVVLKIGFPPGISQYLAFKGSITINGVSLTISKLQKDWFAVDLIPHTLKNTNLDELKKGDKVNLEVDMIARYLEKMLENKEKEAKFEFLKKRNLI